MARFARRIENKFFVAFIIVLSSWQLIEAKDYFNVIEKLHADLLKNYNKQIRPVINHTQTVNVEAGLTLTNIHFDEASSHFSAQGFFYMTWKDPRFVWSPTDYEGLESIHLPGEIVWSPDIEVYNTPGKLNKDRLFAVTNDVLVTSDGSVFYVPLSNFISVCHPDLTNWPYDTQACLIKLGSWTHNVHKMKITLKDNSTTVNTEYYDASKSKWNLVQTSAQIEQKIYSCCPEPYEALNYRFYIERRSPSKFTIIIPTIGIAVLTLITFFIPPTLSAKLTIGAVDLILLCAYLIHFDSTLPPSEAIPRLVVFHGETIILVIFSMLVSVFTMNLTQKSRPPPACIQKCLSSSFGRFMGASQSSQQANSELALEDKKLPAMKESLHNGKINQNDFKNDGKTDDGHWIAFSVIVHRLMFIIYCIIFSVMITTYIFN